MKNSVFVCFFLLAFAGSAASCNAQELGPNAGKRLILKTLAAYPHDKNAYTQGLIFYDGFLYESTGQYGKSSLRKVEIKTGKVLQSTALKSDFFGEGLERVGDSLYQLTWQEGLCFVYDLKTFQYQKSFQYPGEGWGLAYDGTHLILSDGTPTLRFYAPADFTFQKQAEVVEMDSQNRQKKIRNLNELEMVEGELWANRWKSDQIVRIDPKTGRVIGWVNCAAFVPKEYREEHHTECVLNGIAYDQETRTLYITGKNWPVLYEIQVNWE
ncbi:MAG: glutaminyl-peptide cyclotransferase [Planctomycetaceae bacterium]|nr:glutaminyl-peptide cyclotransferase [Planctomycetaceae bacterium]